LTNAASIAHSLLLLVSITVEKSSTSIMSHKSYVWSSSIHCVYSSCTPHPYYLVLTDSIASIHHS
jgi:hypothetical protein